MRLKIFIILIFSFLTREATSQVNIMGKPGYINTPSAEWIEGRPLGFSFSHLPGAYSMFGNEGTSVNFYNARATFTSFFQVNLSIAHRPARAEVDRLGIGDRQFDFRFRLLRERKYLPAIVIGWTPPGSAAPYLAHDYIVATKNIKSIAGNLTFSTGYGSPYVFIKKQDADNFLDFEIQNKLDTRLNTNYLTGFFAAIAYSPVNFAGLMAEYDTNTFNAGAYIKPWDWLILQGTTYEAKEWALTAGLNLSLDLLPKTIRRYENLQD